MSLEAQDMAALELLNGIDAAFWFEDHEEILHLSKVLLQLGLSHMLTADERRMVDTAQALQSHLRQPDAHFRVEYRQRLEQDARTLYFQIWQDAELFRAAVMAVLRRKHLLRFFVIVHKNEGYAVV